MTTQGPPPVETLSELKLTDDIKTAVNGALANGTPVTVAYVDEEGQPSLSFRGSTHIYSDSQLAIWVRNPEGGLQRALGQNNRLTLMYRNPANRTTIQFKGKARVDNNDAVRNKVYDSSPEPERNADKEKKGFPLIIDLERVDGIMPGFRLAMRK